MTTVSRAFDIPITDVFAVLADPWTYPKWLVGAKEMRSVDADWPAPGSSFHHRVGFFGPLTVADSSTSRDVETPTRLVLEVRARPFGRAQVVFRLKSPAPAKAEVEFSENPIGAARILAPVSAPFAAIRNTRSLDHLDRFLQGGRR